MIVHLEDKGEINVAISTDGQVMLVCSECQQMWGGQVAPWVMGAPGDVVGAADVPDVARNFAGEADLLLELGVDAEWLEGFKQA